MSTPKQQDGLDEETVVRLLIGAGVVALITLMLVEWPLLIASTLHGRPTLMPPMQAVSGGIHWLVASGHGDPHTTAWWHAGHSRCRRKMLADRPQPTLSTTSGTTKAKSPTFAGIS